MRRTTFLVALLGLCCIVTLSQSRPVADAQKRAFLIQSAKQSLATGSDQDQAASALSLAEVFAAVECQKACAKRPACAPKPTCNKPPAPSCQKKPACAASSSSSSASSSSSSASSSSSSTSSSSQSGSSQCNKPPSCEKKQESCKKPSQDESSSEASEESSSGGCGGDSESSEGSEESSEGGCDDDDEPPKGCNCSRCAKFDAEVEKRQKQKPALRALKVIAKILPQALDPQLEEVIMNENQRLEDCKMAKLEGKPWLCPPPAFIEQVSCSGWQHQTECTTNECRLMMAKCKNQLVEPVLKDAFYDTIPAEQLNIDRPQCSEAAKAQTCCSFAGQFCCSGSCVVASTVPKNQLNKENVKGLMPM